MNISRKNIRLGLAVMALTAACGGDDHVEPDSVTAGGPPEVHLDAEALELGGIEVGAAIAANRGGLRVTGSITYDQNLVSHVGPKTEGRIDDLRAELGSRVTRGQVLAHLESPEVGTTRADLAEAEALLEIAQETYERETRLEEQGISSRRELLEAEAALRTIEASRNSAQERLRLFGAALHGDGGHFDVVAPFDGVVVARHGARGEVVGPADQLFTVADLRRLWIELDIFERDFFQVTEGQSVEVATAAWPGRLFPARIVYVGEVLNVESRTVRARVEIDNSDGALKPGMFATAFIQTTAGIPVVAVPRDAVQFVEGDDVVWLPADEPGAFVAVPVLLGEELPGGMVEIIEGLTVDEPLVVVGAFTLKAELAKGEFGGHGH